MKLGTSPGCLVANALDNDNGWPGIESALLKAMETKAADFDVTGHPSFGALPPDLQIKVRVICELGKLKAADKIKHIDVTAAEIGQTVAYHTDAIRGVLAESSIYKTGMGAGCRPGTRPAHWNTPGTSLGPRHRSSMVA